MTQGKILELKPPQQQTKDAVAVTITNAEIDDMFMFLVDLAVDVVTKKNFIK